MLVLLTRKTGSPSEGRTDSCSAEISHDPSLRNAPGL